MIPIKDRNPADLFPAVTLLLIAANVAVFFYQISQGPQHFEQVVMSLALVPKTFVAEPLAPNQFTSLFTSMFMHGGILHLVGNMLFLWIFGNNVEDYFGHGKFVFFYLLTGLAATFSHIFTHPGSTIPVIGASGAVSGVLGAYFLLFPRARVLAAIPVFLFFYFVEVPAFLFLGFYIFMQILFALPTLMAGPVDARGIAWFAHIGGFFAGALLLLVLRRRSGFRRRRFL
ncbi:MAG: rhomboid family intramembrane serine protease [Candidatus Abyssobacteria bacterium SURF_5]|uniref:Rhomboid family intramembrane serine protease n=1 Tax=Abyssobacteria bacterium (strain SURF_5) TaxID=2093360 RepID=A0A3A4MZ16_ABYX5|nr:MAG: rhomboid family intramembrane serine protease [Candidatus Abyssubacteria bacterium SURF_5]